MLQVAHQALPARRRKAAAGADPGAGECIPGHYHSAISDSCVCLDGPIVVETQREPPADARRALCCRAEG